MKNKLLTGTIIILVLLALSVYIVKLTNDLYNSERKEIVLEYYDPYVNRYISYSVSKGILRISDTVTGQVVFEEDAIREYHAEKTNGTEIQVQVGQSIKKGDALCISGKKTISADADGKVINIDESDGVRIFILDYSKSYIVAHIPEGRQERLCANTLIRGEINGKEGEEGVPLSLKSIEPVIDSNGFMIRMNNVFQAFENTPVNIYIEYEQKENVIIVPKEYVKINSNGEAYVTIGNDITQAITKHTVRIGEESNDDYELLDADELDGVVIVYDTKDLAINGN